MTMETLDPRPVALLTGVGPGTGTALVRRFVAGGYRVAMLARDAGRLAALAAELPDAQAYVCDVADNAAIDATLARVRAELGAPAVLIHNAVAGGRGHFMDMDPALLERGFQVNVMALLHLARALAPDMIAAGQGAIVVTGNTSSQRGRAAFAGLAPTKAAQRILCEAMARDLGPQGVHVAYVVIDAVIDVPWTRQRFADQPDSFFMQTSAIADEVWHLVHQQRSAWSFLHELRPFGETW
ncbi:SDR family NAD(P)-dependent oxidoreductase [Zoogloea sp.]|uniref:SDR family NAD(P)-dependent oxidoreductase n=1 Tax=Zoogloea sp. TaxID=49181 RepID=UPI002623F1D5|nr:SDR family NAD(P)-dependent oxidoreductase [Zoogloea sp.]MDD3353820.1 SDR family NAD(P)-dependent oxidoreductase [Zoogloea sp.]